MTTAPTIVLTPDSPGYPARLRPLGRTIYVRGPIHDDANDGPAVAIVGARAATRLGMDRAHALGRHLAERRVRVVSGGALGIDGAAHRGALAGGGMTTVVLGGGVDVAYPARHARLFLEVTRAGGTLASLVPDGTAPWAALFPQRNLVIAALADLVVVVEADVRSGSLSTARAAIQQGRVVVAYPGSPGCERLLARGAAVAEAPDDVDRALAGDPRMPRAPEDEDDVARRVRAALAAGIRGVDAIATAAGLPVRAVVRALPLIERYS